MNLPEITPNLTLRDRMIQKVVILFHAGKLSYIDYRTELARLKKNKQLTKPLEAYTQSEIEYHHTVQGLPLDHEL